MRIRIFLIVHSSRSIRAMMARYILSECSDVDIIEAGNGQDALLHLTKQSFDLVICDSDLEDMTILELRAEMMECSSENKTVDYIALSGTADDMKPLANAGFAHVITLPFDPVSFIGKINQICDPRKWRQNERFHLPGSNVIINVWGMEAKAGLINISRGGALVEVSGDRSDLLLQNDTRLTFKIKFPGGYNEIKDLPSKLTRLNVIEWNKSFKPTVMRVAYIFLELNQTSKTELEQVVRMAKERHQDADEQ